MHTNDQKVFQEISTLLNSQRLAVLATERNGQPYASLMAFAHTPDLTRIVVATGMATRKHTNLLGESRVSLLIDSRTNSEADFHAAVALTIIGDAAETTAQERPHYQQLYLARHPYLEKFLLSPTTALFVIKIRHYLLVNKFQHVMELHFADEPEILP
ncbi:pyridoxamine 5'-phosphate oxidase family protein [Desulfopila aestuarii]|uniref:Pyridoxamine 5'-phosphate oxidase n=1 Tax=Desulfopila aestuarii DSM 18488 TaxID=1121416 RepID=A0A1M7Y5C8_9BACT|nr:pyridoxamine 5'-phosphate oxidase family protein [Desulfopila aestuarii]SHO47577.1 Pyridoxamine 5'-phosphate oxidase [Desulfopila aestuarii DSM 18488]